MYTHKEIHDLCDQYDYAQALDSCMELLKAGDPANLWDTDLLLIRCYLGSMPPAKAKEAGNVVLMTIENLLLLSETPEKLFKAVETIRGYVDEWKRYYSLMLLQMVIDSPVQEQLHLYFGSCPQCVSFEMEVEAAISQHSQLQKYASAQNCDIQTLRNQYEITHQSSFTEEDQKEMEYRTACFLFQNAVNSFEEMMVGPKAQVIKACEEIMQTYVLIDVLLSRAIEAVEDAEIKKERLYKRAEIQQYELDAVVSMDGAALSLWVNVDTRIQKLNELRETYDQILEIDPTFIMPMLPEVEPIKAPSDISAGSGGGGGCYVATAVYGSYDCPEVWTLRRFRDNTLAETWYGRAFIRTYYAISPTLVKWFGRTEWFKKMWRGKLDKMVNQLQKQGVENTPYQDRNW